MPTYCDDALLIRGLEPDCRAWIEAIPVTQRAQWDCMLFLEETPGQPKREGVVYFVCRWGTQQYSTPLPEAILRDAEAQATLAPRFLERAWFYLEARAVPA